MFDHLLLRAGDPRSIKLQTKDGWDILNQVGAEPTEDHVRRFDLLVQLSGTGWVIRKGPSGGYNCAGHVFANRRTEVIEGQGKMTFEQHVREILRRDDYRQFEHGPVETACIGDVVAYWDAESTVPQLLHVGVIFEIRPIHGVGPHIGAPFVLSKWNGGSGECLHHFRHVPSSWGKYTVEFWTDRPAVGGKR